MTTTDLQFRVGYRLYIGQDEGVYFSQPADGKVKLTTDAGGADDIELEGGITLDGDVTIDTGHTFTWSNDGTSASANTSYTTVATTLASGNCIGYIPITIGAVSARLMAWSGGQYL